MQSATVYEDKAMNNDVGDIFQTGTKYIRHQLSGHFLDWANRPQTYKRYLSKKIPLNLDDAVKSNACTPFIEVLKERRSVRSFAGEPIRLPELAFLLWASTGIRKNEGDGKFRTAPSAGALYPIETYVIVNNVDSLQKGLYHYGIMHNELEELKIGDFEEQITRSAMKQEMCAEAQVVFVWTAVFARTKWKYLQRGYRSIYQEAGHIAQNLALSAISIGLGSCQIGGFFDDEVNAIIGVDGQEESTIYLSAVGHPT